MIVEVKTVTRHRIPIRRSGGILIYVLLGMTVFVALVSLAVDVSHVRVVKRQLQRTADAAARAAITGFATSMTAAQNNAIAVAGANIADGTPVVLNPNTDIEFGTWDASSATFTPLSGAAQATATAIRVTARRTAATGNAVQLPFASMIGVGPSDVKARAIAVSSTYGFSIVGLSSLTVSKSGASGNRSALIDSWNSAAGPYGTFPMGYHGNCSSNGSVNLVSGTVIDGSCQPGTGKTVTGGTISGSTTPLSYTLNFPAPNPGQAATVNNNSNLPSAYFNSLTRDFTIPNNTALTLPGGTYYVNNINWNNATITFTGPAVFYVTGTFFTHNNYVTTYQSLPKNLKFEVTSAVTVTYDFDQAVYAVLYAPLATVTTMGLADDYGSVVGNSLTMTVGWHVDVNFTGPVVFYVTGTGTSKHPANGFWTFNNHITTYQNAPANLVFEVTTNTSVQYDIDQPIYAAVYAPLSTVTTWGNADDYGSIVGNVLNMYTGWHVDDALSADGGGPSVPVQGSYIEVQ